MALTGVHVELGISATKGNSTVFSRIWSETIALGGTTTQAVPDVNAPQGNYVFRVRGPAGAEVYVSTGLIPDATAAISSTDNNVRAHFATGDIRDLEAKRNWKVNAIAVP